MQNSSAKAGKSRRQRGSLSTIQSPLYTLDWAGRGPLWGRSPTCPVEPFRSPLVNRHSRRRSRRCVTEFQHASIHLIDNPSHRVVRRKEIASSILEGITIRLTLVWIG